MMNDIFPDAAERRIAVEVFCYFGFLHAAYRRDQQFIFFIQQINVYKLGEIYFLYFADKFFLLARRFRPALLLPGKKGKTYD